MQVVICPICKGEGKICLGINAMTLQPVLKDCHGCGTYPHGRGWIVIPEVIKFPIKAVQ